MLKFDLMVVMLSVCFIGLVFVCDCCVWSFGGSEIFDCMIVKCLNDLIWMI